MVHFLIKRGADANSWPMMNEVPLEGRRNYYLEDIDIHYMDESLANDKDIDYLKALHRTARVLVEDANLGPYRGNCLTIDDAKNVSLRTAQVLF